MATGASTYTINASVPYSSVKGTFMLRFTRSRFDLKSKFRWKAGCMQLSVRKDSDRFIIQYLIELRVLRRAGGMMNVSRRLTAMRILCVSSVFRSRRTYESNL